MNVRLLFVALVLLSGCPEAVVPGDDDDIAPNDDDTGQEDCGAISTIEDGLAPGQELHVAPDGSDATGDGSPASPFATVTHAAGLATPGTAIVLAEGVHAGGIFLSDLAGTADAPIWIGGAAGTRPVLEGGNTAMQVVRGRYLVVHDLEVRGSADNGLNFDDGGDVDDAEAAHHVLFRDLYIHDIGGDGNQDCLKLSGLCDYQVLDSEMHDCGGGGSGSGIDHVGCHRGLIARNHLHTGSGNAVQCKGGSTDIEIRWNRIEDAGARSVNMGGSTGLQFFRPPVSDSEPNAEARDIRVVANVIEGAEASLAFVGCVDCVAVHNTIVDPDQWLFRILQETTSDATYEFEPCQRGTWANNLVLYDRSALSEWEDVNIGPDTAPETFVFATNLWYAHDDPAASEPTLPAPESGAVLGQDPQLAADRSIPASSPAAGAGTAWPGVTGDLLGACYADPPSIGAFEVP